MGVHAEQVGVPGGLLQRAAGAGVGGVDHLQPPAGGAQHLMGEKSPRRLSLLQGAPQADRDAQRPGPVRVKPAAGAG